MGLKKGEQGLWGRLEGLVVTKGIFSVCGSFFFNFASTLHSGPFRDGNLDRMNRISRGFKEDM